MASLVVLVGFDFRRVIDGVRYWHRFIPIEHIYLLYDRRKDTFGYASRRNTEDLHKVLSFAFHQPTKIGVNMQSYDDVFSILYVVLKKETHEYSRDVYIDVTSTSKEAYGATLVASLLFQRRVHPYIVPSSIPEWEVFRQEQIDFEEWFTKVRNIQGREPIEIFLPPVEPRLPDRNGERILIVLLDHGGKAPSIKRLIEWCNEDPTDPVIKNRFSRIIRKLINEGLVISKAGSRNKPLHLTGFGFVLAKALKKFRYYEEKQRMLILKDIELPPSTDSSLYLEEEPSFPA